MVAKKNGGIVDYLVLGLTVFLIFCLVFEPVIAVPLLLDWVGHWHPLLVHFPIVLLLLAIFLQLFSPGLPTPLLAVAVLSALITAITGFFLGKGVEPKGELLTWHQWLGASVAMVSSLWYWLHKTKKFVPRLRLPLLVVLAFLIGIAGHYGGMVTHGEDYLALPFAKQNVPIPDNPKIYGDVVFRILDNKCTSCHNSAKRKGELVMTSHGALLKGGESGITVIPGDPGGSEIIRRLLLPEDDEEHMPPEGKPALNNTEIAILERWIELGASDSVRLNHLDIAEPLAGLVKGLMEPDPMEKWSGLPVVADSTLQRLATDYLTIRRVAGQTEALSINAYLPPTYDPRSVTDLARIATNIVELDLSGLPLGAAEMDMVAACTNLEWLELDRTAVSDREFSKLKTLDKIELLKIYQTGIGDSSVAVFKNLVNLRHLYIWDTGFTQSGLNLLMESRPGLSVNSGYGLGFPVYQPPADTLRVTE
jgi:hypothetical protein